MELPALTESNKLAVAALTKYSAEYLDPLPYFQSFAERAGVPLEEDKSYSEAIYPDFEDYEYLHDTCNLKPIYLNDFDFNLEEDRERLAEITRIEFAGTTFDNVAKCGCGKLKGNYLLNSGRTCRHCGGEVELFLDKGEDTLLWLRAPEGVKAFVNIGFFSTFFNNVCIGSPKICIPRFFIDPIYRGEIKRANNVTKGILHGMLDELKIEEVNLNVFIERCDDIMSWVFEGNGRRYFKKPQEAALYLELYIQKRYLAFPKYLKVPNRYSTVLEKQGKEIRSYEYQPQTAQVYFAIADTLKSNSVYKLNARDIKKNIDIVGKNITKLADQYRKVNNPKTLFNKMAINRKHVCSGALPITGRSVITSRTGIINGDEIMIPWKMCLSMLEIHIKSHLYRKGYTPHEALWAIHKAAHEIDPVIKEFFQDAERTHKLLLQSGRNPIIEYLSLRTSWMRVNYDLNDESIKIPITGVKQQNA